MTVTHVIRNGELYKVEEAPAPKVTGPQRHISDVQDLLWHPTMNRYSDSKSRFREWTRQSGCREIGNDVSLNPTRKPPKLDKHKRAMDIKRAIEQLRSR